MKKKYIIISLLALSVSLVACGEANTVPDVVEETVEEAVENIVEEPQEEAIDETEEVVEEVIEEPNEVAEEVIEQSTTEEVVAVEAEPAEVAYTYSDTSATMYAKSTVNVRDLPDKSGNKVGSLSQNQEVTVTGKCNETGWYRIEYNGSTAYVSNSFLVIEKVEVALPAENPPSTGNSGSGKYTTEYGQTYTMTYDDVAAAFGQPIGVVIPDSDTTGHFYVIISHLRGIKGSPIQAIEGNILNAGWTSVSTNTYVAEYDNANWHIQIGYCSK